MIIAISIIGLIFDPAVKYHGLVAMPSLTGEDGKSLIFSLDIMGALQPTVLPSVLALVMTAVFDATGTIRAVAGQANLLDKDNQIINGGKALTSDSVSSIFSGLVGAAPAAVYIESAAGTAAGVNRVDRNRSGGVIPADSVLITAVIFDPLVTPLHPL